MPTALITGASRGLGAAIALAQGLAGNHVAVNYHRNAAAAEAVCQQIRQAGGRAFSFQADIRDPAQITALVADVEARLGPIGILVPNATGPQPDLPIEDQTWDAHLAQLEFFVKSPLLLLQAVLPGMKARRHGRVINIGSEVVSLGNPNFAHYVAAKAAQLGLTRSWANELAPDGITVNLVEPGWIPTERFHPSQQTALEGYIARVPMRQTGQPVDIGATVAFLSSDAARFITGQTLAVNGGNTLS